MEGIGVLFDPPRLCHERNAEVPVTHERADWASLPTGNQSEGPRDEYHGLPNSIPSQDNEAPRQ